MARPFRPAAFLLTVLSCTVHAYAPVPLRQIKRAHRSPQVVVSSQLASSQNDDQDSLDDNDSPDDASSFAKRSKMPQFIDAFLQKERKKRGEVRPDTYTHMVGVPMTDNHELQIELESIQRAILFHCPSLVHACITASASRMPLLYIDASREPAGSVTLELQEIVEKVVKKHFLQEEFDGDVANYAGINEEGYRPLTMTFSRLQIDGEGNEALYTVAEKDVNGGLTKLQSIVTDLEHALEERGWKTMLPPNNVQGNKEQEEKEASSDFIPRIPLMRLPDDFERYLRPLEDDKDLRLAEDGGNGISPIYWIKWIDDVLGKNVRLREIGIYPRRPGMNTLTEKTFFLAHETVALPGGNEAISNQEMVHQQYNEKRLEEAERRYKEEGDGEVEDSGDFIDPSTDENRKILESIYGKDSEIFDDGLLQGITGEGDSNEDVLKPKPKSLGASAPLDDWMKARINAVAGTESTDEPPPADPTQRQATTSDESTTTKSDDAAPPIDDWMTERIRAIVEDRPSNQQRQAIKTSSKKVLALDANPVFKAYRDGSLVTKSQDLGVSAPVEEPQFPSEELFRGFWRIVRSPVTSSLDDTPDDTRCDNFCLRVDGTVSGGPILDAETKQKAGGGTWKMTETEDVTWLRIRCVIPPKRDRIMVWEGEVYKEKASTSSSNSASILDAASFSKVLGDGGDADDDAGEVIKFSGSVWTEDAVTRKNRKDLGSCLLFKVDVSSDPRDFTITIPKAIRNQD